MCLCPIRVGRIWNRLPRGVVPHSWRRPGSGWAGPWATRSSWKCYCLQSSWTRWSLPTEVIQWLCNNTWIYMQAAGTVKSVNYCHSVPSQHFSAHISDNKDHIWCSSDLLPLSSYISPLHAFNFSFKKVISEHAKKKVVKERKEQEDSELSCNKSSCWNNFVFYLFLWCSSENLKIPVCWSWELLLTTWRWYGKAQSNLCNIMYVFSCCS